MHRQHRHPGVQRVDIPLSHIGGYGAAAAEVVARVRRVLDSASVVWQMAELGKVDAGGGTVAAYMAERNIDTLALSSTRRTRATTSAEASEAPDLPRAPVYLHRPIP